MKILILGPAFPFRGGIARFNESLAFALIARKHQVKIFSFTKQYPDIFFPGKNQFHDEAPDASIDIERIIHGYNPLKWKQAVDAGIAWQPDLVLIRFWIPLMAPALVTVAKRIKKKTNCSIVGLADNIIPHEKRLFDGLLTRYFINACGGFMVLSKQVEADLLRLKPDAKVLFHPHPLYDHYGEKVSRKEALKHLGLDESHRYILFFGFIRKYKGLDLLLQAFATIRAGHPDVKLIVAGEFYEDKQPYIEQIKASGLQDRVILEDRFVSESEVRFFFCAASLVAQTYRSATQSGVTQIAYHFERPMLVTDVGGLPEIVPHGICGYVCPPESAALAEKLDAFFRLNQEEEFSRNCSLEKKKYSWDTWVDKFLSLVARVQSGS